MFSFRRLRSTVWRVSTFKPLSSLLGATAIAGVLTAAALSPAAAIAGVTIQRTGETMESNLENIAGGETPGVSVVTDVEGNRLAYLYEQRRYPVASEEIAQPMKDAIVAIEDRRFYEHDGVDFQGTMRALVANLSSGGVAEGASTIDQQYVKNYLLLVEADDPEEEARAVETSIPRKLREMRMASELDSMFSKDEILARYLNLVPFGSNSYGVEAAARTYFDTSAAELTVPQAAMLAGLVQSTSGLDPYANPDGALERRNTVIDAMAQQGYLDAGEAEGYKEEPLGVLDEPQGLSNGCITAGDRGFMCDYALNYLDSKGLSAEDIAGGSYTIRTTLDPGVQDAAREVATGNVDPGEPGVAEVLNVVAPTDERPILAMTSSRSYGLDQDAHETMLPQATTMVGNGAGSVYKIFAAAVALDQGMGLDQPLAVPNRYEGYGLGDGGAAGCPEGAYCVENSGSYPGTLTLRQALAQSPNTTFVQLIEEFGVAPVVDMATALGLRSHEKPGSFDDSDAALADVFKDNNLGSFVLGPTAVNPLELSNVGASIAAHGRWCEPNPIAEITNNATGEQVPLERPECEDVLEPGAADALAAGMSDDSNNGTAQRAANAAGFDGDVSAKTGTTSDNLSAAFLGFTSEMAAAPYIFNDGTQTTPLCSGPVRQCPDGNLFGGNEPADTWFQLAERIPQGGSGVAEHDPVFNEGTAKAALREVEGMSEREAREFLEEHGFEVGQVRRVPGEGRERDEVVAVRPEGPVYRYGGTIDLEVSDGREPRRAERNADNWQDRVDELTREIEEQLNGDDDN